MSRTALHTYLNDHLAGSVMAIELIDHLVKIPVEAEFFTALRSEISADQQALEDLLQQVGGKQSGLRKAGAWVAEKLAEVKLEMDDSGGGKLRLFQALETLALGIQGKLSLWVALEAAGDGIAELRAIDLPRLQQRARDQYADVEARRVAAGREVLAAT